MAKYDLKSNKILKYSGLATQLFVSMGLAAWFGSFLDRKLQLEKPILTALCSMFMLIAFMVWLNYDLKRMDK
ncbi:MAG: AtpZ/AtpI family protein [Saprospiraceae bacterium]